jgi:hypothetical protein
MTRPGTFQKGNKLASGSRGQFRRDLRISLISKLNEIFDKRTGETKLQRVVSNLVAQAAGVDEYDKKGKLVKRDTGNLAAIKEIFDRVEGRAPQKPPVCSSDDGWGMILWDLPIREGPMEAFSPKRVLLDHLATIKDTRESCKVAYPLREVLFLVVCGTIASGDDYDDIVDWGEAHLSFLRGFSEFFGYARS